MNNASQLAFDLTEQGLIPDIVIRRGIRHLVKQRLREIGNHDCELMAKNHNNFLEMMQQSSIALLPEKANEQHYEVPAQFYLRCLGPHLKYSSAYWPAGVSTLAEAEAAALAESCNHASLADGQDILELGCGWGSLTLWMAKHYPNSRITAVSNSHSQRDHIKKHARIHNLKNIQIITCDMNEFDTRPEHFDRVVSVEMFEHMRNWKSLYEKIAKWLKPGGMFFKHIFVHRTTPYLFEDNGPGDWMSRYFFSGGMMPCDDLPLCVKSDLNFEQRWRWNGAHYAKTTRAWLDNMNENRQEIQQLFTEVYGENEVQRWWVRWRLFFMACEELFAYDDGQQWWISHYLFSKPGV